MSARDGGQLPPPPRPGERFTAYLQRVAGIRPPPRATVNDSPATADRPGALTARADSPGDPTNCADEGQWTLVGDLIPREEAA